jgi:hypothetical protein
VRGIATARAGDGGEPGEEKAIGDIETFRAPNRFRNQNTGTVNTVAFVRVVKEKGMGDEDVGKFIERLKELGAISNRGFILLNRLPPKETKLRKVCKEYNEKIGARRSMVAEVRVNKKIFPFGKITREEEFIIKQEGLSHYEDLCNMYEILKSGRPIDGFVKALILDGGVDVTPKNFFSVFKSCFYKIAAALEIEGIIRKIEEITNFFKVCNLLGTLPISIVGNELFFGNGKTNDRTANTSPPDPQPMGAENSREPSIEFGTNQVRAAPPLLPRRPLPGEAGGLDFYP